MNPSVKTLRPQPPEKGSFPLDHEGECKTAMQLYMGCLKRCRNDNHLCREEAKAYLQCRMDKQLMAKQDFSKLGYHSPDKD
eukprot:Em0018g979a